MLTFRLLKTSETNIPVKIANWYMEEWSILPGNTVQQLTNRSNDSNVIFQLLMYENNQLIGTGGVYHKVGIHRFKPMYSQHQNWLALMFTLPQFRGKGYGLQLLQAIESKAAERNLKELYLFTDSAANLYKRANYSLVETIVIEDRSLTVMKKPLK